ncbi:zinc finger MYM-type protein 4 isoform X3 [Nothobranchius furzeri]|uniref:Zinc finger MYM-type protein 4-like n=2 Tax=Nothobranchius furzeri TaxID=105023 RepID=A0A8C6PMM9_NOTFU|nr:zinc finger MYM-type protein 4 isoform X3 [Nothobranchius furzeri]
MSEAGDEAEHQVASQSPPEAAETGENHSVSMEEASEPGTSADVGDPESGGESSRNLPEVEEGQEQENKPNNQETEHHSSSEESIKASESEIENSEMKTDDEPELKEEMKTVRSKSPEETAAGPEDKTSDDKDDVKQTDDDMKTEEEKDGIQEKSSPSGDEEDVKQTKDDMKTEEEKDGIQEEKDGIQEEKDGIQEEKDGIQEEKSSPSGDEEDVKQMDDESKEEKDGMQEDKSSLAGKPSVSMAEDLDEMMDIGTVDQVDQEAQMKEEDQNSSESSCSAAELQKVIVPSSAEEEADVKPTTSDLIRSSSSPSSETATSTGRESSSPPVNGMKTVKQSLPRLNDENSKSESDPIKSSPPPSPPLTKVKDEPVDEEYDQALVSATSTASVKDEPGKDDLKIGSVFSVTPPAESQTQPNTSSLHMSCSYCKKNLLKGQTAFQRKGSPALFCSTACLTTSLPSVRGPSKVCFNCQKLIFRPQEVIQTPDSKGNVREFCSQNCLTAFNYKQNPVGPKLSAGPTKPAQSQSVCSMCSITSTSKHEVILSGTVHKMCSDACFNRFRTVNNLSMAGCACCGSFCHSRPLMLKMDDSSKTLCNSECLAKFKEKTKINQTCSMCRSVRPVPQMVDNKNSDDSVNLFCSNSCVMAFKVQSVSSSGTRLNCDYCSKTTVPSYHLAMSDTSIRNFCSLPCVMSFQEKFKKSQSQLSVFTKLSVASSQSPVATTTVQKKQPETKEPSRLACCQCSKSIVSKPELIQIKDKLLFFCSADCSAEYKKVNAVISLCEYCKIKKFIREAKRIDNKDCYFCSDGCKLLFRHELSKNWGKHCQACAYCQCVSRKLVTAQYGTSIEEFCSDECRSKYTMLFCHVAKCDSCGRKGKLKESLPLLGEVKHFCGLICMLKFCIDTVVTQGPVNAGAGEDTPVIANVVSLADQSAEDINDTPAAPSANSHLQSKSCGHISTQTEPMRSHPPPPPPKVLKNKALLCRPLVQNKGVSCRAQMAEAETQTDDAFPKVLVLPVPVPVYLPVPMGMYSQYAPKPVGLPLPLPVPMFLPVTMNSAERIVETIKEIKQKIPSNPFEAELILMAEMVAEEEEEKDDKQETQKEKAFGNEAEKPEAAAGDDRVSNYSDDLDTDDLASFLNNWEDPSSDSGLKLSSQSNASGKPTTYPEDTPPEPYVEPLPPPMDIEADFTIETVERMARMRELCRTPSPSPVPKRRQAARKARDKRGRKSQRPSKAAEAASPRKMVCAEMQKLKSEYGVDAWKRWIQWRQTQPNLEQRRLGSRPLELREDLLRCTTAELSYGLCCFINEVKRPGGEQYSPDSLFYLCLGIQQYLFENGRVENIFMDHFYGKFSSEFTSMLKGFKPTVTSSGYVHSRVEENFLWDCKQLGAYSPIVLLNTLLFFGCKYFGFTTVEQHRQLSFAHVMRCTKTNPNGTKTTFLRFYPPISVNETELDPDVVPAKRRKEEGKEEILEMMENTENPLRCPVRLYEFYLSKCSESVKQRTNMFYLHPERCCVPNSPLWFSSTPLDDGAMEAMLTRILVVRELHLKAKKDDVQREEGVQKDDPPFIPDGQDEDSE